MSITDMGQIQKARAEFPEIERAMANAKAQGLNLIDTCQIMNRLRRCMDRGVQPSKRLQAEVDHLFALLGPVIAEMGGNGRAAKALWDAALIVCAEAESLPVRRVGLYLSSFARCVANRGLQD